jgi:hypothetical protein
MKATTTIATVILLAGTRLVHSQGSIYMNDYVGGSFLVQVFQAQPLASSPVLIVDGSYSGYEEMGNPANSFLSNPGTTVYPDTPSTIGQFGTYYDVGLLGAAGTAATSYSQLSLAAGSVSSAWNSMLALNPVNNTQGTWSSSDQLATIPGVSSSGLATIAIAVWQNTGAAGAASTLAAAQADGYTWGVSDMVTVTTATGTGMPPNLPTTLTSFSMVDPVPEPSTIALGLMGGSAVLGSRRLKALPVIFKSKIGFAYLGECRLKRTESLNAPCPFIHSVHQKEVPCSRHASLVLDDRKSKCSSPTRTRARLYHQ